MVSSDIERWQSHAIYKARVKTYLYKKKISSCWATAQFLFLLRTSLCRQQIWCPWRFFLLCTGSWTLYLCTFFEWNESLCTLNLTWSTLHWETEIPSFHVSILIWWEPRNIMSAKHWCALAFLLWSHKFKPWDKIHFLTHWHLKTLEIFQSTPDTGLL